MPVKSILLFKYESRSSVSSMPRFACNKHFVIYPRKYIFWMVLLQCGKMSMFKMSFANSRFLQEPVSLSIFMGVYITCPIMYFRAVSWSKYLFASTIDPCSASNIDLMDSLFTSNTIILHISSSLIMPSARNKINNGIGILTRGIWI